MNKKVFAFIEELGLASGSNKKKELLGPMLEDPEFVRLCKFALDQDRRYNIKKFPDHDVGLERMNPNKERVYEFLEKLAAKRGASADEKKTLHKLACQSPEIYACVRLILKKNLGCGIQAKTINSLKKDLIYRVPYQRCADWSQLKRLDLKNGVYVQKKADGMFAYAFPNGTGEGQFLTRKGIWFTVPGNPVSPEIDEGWVSGLTGGQEPVIAIQELLVLDEEGKVLPRKTGNGLINKFISGKGKDKTLPERIRSNIFGFITLQEYRDRKSEIPYSHVWEEIVDVYNFITIGAEQPSAITPIQTRPVDSVEGIMDYYVYLRELEEEGAVVKDPDQPWEDKDDSNHVKVKPVCEAEFEIIEACYGGQDGKWKNLMGSLVIKTSCGGIVTKVGMGFSDEERTEGVPIWNSRKGEIITCQFTGVIDDKTSRVTKCLSEARYVESRFTEKDEADTLAYCESQECVL